MTRLLSHGAEDGNGIKKRERGAPSVKQHRFLLHPFDRTTHRRALVLNRKHVHERTSRSGSLGSRSFAGLIISFFLTFSQAAPSGTHVPFGSRSFSLPTASTLA